MTTEFSFSSTLTIFLWCLEKIEQRRRFAFETPYSPDMNLRILKSLIDFSEYELFETVRKASCGSVRIHTSKKSLTGTTSNFASIRRYRCPRNPYYLTAVSKRHPSRFSGTKERLG